MKCNHPKTKIREKRETRTESGYGCDQYYDVITLECTKCGAQSRELGSYDGVYREFTGRDRYADEASQRRRIEIEKAREWIKTGQAILTKWGLKK